MTRPDLIRLRKRYQARRAQARREACWLALSWLAALLVTSAGCLNLTVLILWGCHV